MFTLVKNHCVVLDPVGVPFFLQVCGIVFFLLRVQLSDLYKKNLISK